MAEKRSLKEHVDNHPTLYVIGVAIAAAGFTFAFVQNALLAPKEAEVRSLQFQLDQKTKEIAYFQAQNERKEGELKNSQADASRAKSDLATLGVQLKQKEAEAKASEAQIEPKNAELKRLQNQSDQKDVEIKALQAQAQKSDAELKRVQTQLAQQPRQQASPLQAAPTGPQSGRVMDAMFQTAGQSQNSLDGCCSLYFRGFESQYVWLVDLLVGEQRRSFRLVPGGQRGTLQVGNRLYTVDATFNGVSVHCVVAWTIVTTSR